MPERMQDQYIRVYCKQRDPSAIEALRTAFTQWCSLNGCVPPHSAGEMTPSHTPQKAHQKRAAPIPVAGPRILNQVRRGACARPPGVARGPGGDGDPRFTLLLPSFLSIAPRHPQADEPAAKREKPAEAI